MTNATITETLPKNAPITRDDFADEPQTSAHDEACEALAQKRYENGVDIPDNRYL